MRSTSGWILAACSAQRRAAASTVAASGHLRTDEVKDRTGMPDGLLALERAVVLERRPLRMAVGISRGNVEVVEHAGPLDQIGGHTRRVRNLREKPGHDVSPRLLPE